MAMVAALYALLGLRLGAVVELAVRVPENDSGTHTSRLARREAHNLVM
jgi:hypothetical protein